MLPQDLRDDSAQILSDARDAANQALQHNNVQTARNAFNLTARAWRKIGGRGVDLSRFVVAAVDKWRAVGRPPLPELYACVEIYAPVAQESGVLDEAFLTAREHAAAGRRQQAYDALMVVIDKLCAHSQQMVEAEKKARELYRTMPLGWKRECPALGEPARRIRG